MDNEVVVTYQVWRDDECLASWDHLEDAKFYAERLLRRDPRVKVYKVTSTLEVIDHLA